MNGHWKSLEELLELKERTQALYLSEGIPETAWRVAHSHQAAHASLVFLGSLEESPDGDTGLLGSILCDFGCFGLSLIEENPRGLQDWEIAQKSMYRLAAQGLPPGAFTAVLFLCGCEDSEDVGDFEVQIDK
ncbi:hypothetical protein DEO72_LG5g2056 [Vigna unguiculata]|uniref:Uncharacterized protein n=1 Tax=Vigna unguiculata TaxID=3917 RepID=A0A4D6LYB0_VIGUN|nr:hypothetical protein DEO72_LG5g2056 [Vigna unguiculata]